MEQVLLILFWRRELCLLFIDVQRRSGKNFLRKVRKRTCKPPVFMSFRIIKPLNLF